MREAIGNLWNEYDKGQWIVITTNGTVKNNKQAVMGRGCALEAASRFPQLPSELGLALSNLGNHVHVFPHLRIITFPVKHNWWEYADRKLIGRSAVELIQVVSYLKRISGLDLNVYCPRFGCGNGNLSWEESVRPLVRGLLADNFIVMTQG